MSKLGSTERSYPTKCTHCMDCGPNLLDQPSWLLSGLWDPSRDLPRGPGPPSFLLAGGLVSCQSQHPQGPRMNVKEGIAGTFMSLAVTTLVPTSQLRLAPFLGAKCNESSKKSSTDHSGSPFSRGHSNFLCVFEEPGIRYQDFLGKKKKKTAASAIARTFRPRDALPWHRDSGDLHLLKLH